MTGSGKTTNQPEFTSMDVNFVLHSGSTPVFNSPETNLKSCHLK